jgi:hypothetical protein
MARARKKPAKGKAKPRKAKSRRKPTSARKATPKSRSAATPKSRSTAKPKSRSTATPKRTAKPAPRPSPVSAIPAVELPETPSTEIRRRASTARERALHPSPVLEIVENEYPLGALRRFLDSIKGTANVQQGQIALGSAQLVLPAIARGDRGGQEVQELLDLVLERWADFPDRTGFHAQEFLRNAFAAVGVDRARIAKLVALVPADASAELWFNIARAHAVARDKVAMLDAIEHALAAGFAAAQFRRDADFAPYTADPDFARLLARAEVPQIPVDIQPFVRPVRVALDALAATVRELGERVELRPPVRLDAILDAERARKISLPNDYRALLTITNGMKVWDREFFGAGDYRDATPLAVRAQQYLEMSAKHGATGIEDCVPLANWGQPNDWLLYDPRGLVRGGEPGYVVMLNADGIAYKDLVTVLARLEALASDVLGTN